MALTLTETAQGKVKMIPGDNPEITVFKGMLYAATPVGELRWREPQSPICWDGTRLCNEFVNISVM